MARQLMTTIMARPGYVDDYGAPIKWAYFNTPPRRSRRDDASTRKTQNTNTHARAAKARVESSGCKTGRLRAPQRYIGHLHSCKTIEFIDFCEHCNKFPKFAPAPSKTPTGGLPSVGPSEPRTLVHNGLHDCRFPLQAVENQEMCADRKVHQLRSPVGTPC